MLKQPELASNYKHPEQAAGVLLQPDVYRRMQSGINQVVNAIRPTLGSNPRLVGIERYPRDKAPELLDDGGTIARRIIELPDQHENVGAMLVRGMLWRLQEQVGDGTATAAILCQHIFNEGVRYIAAGGNAMLLRRHLETAMTEIIDYLQSQVMPVTGSSMLRHIAGTVCDDEKLAKSIGEIFEIVGEYGLVDVQSGNTLEPHVRYFEGSYWTGGIHTATASVHNQAIELIDTAILLTDFALEEPEQVVPILRTALQADVNSLVIMARSVSDKVVGLIKRSQESSRLKVVAVKTPGTTSQAQAEALLDLTALTGGQPLLEVTGDSPDRVQAAHSGWARRIWMDKNYIGVKGGKGDIIKLRQHIATLQQAYNNATKPDVQTILRDRIGRLQGGLAILYVGGATKTEADTRRTTTNRAIKIVRRTLRDGVLSGGGTTLLSCQQMLQNKIQQSQSTDEKAAYRILHDSMKAPFCTLAYNAGYEGGAILAQIDHAGEGWGFDFARGKLVELGHAGIFDSATAQIEAVKHAIKTAALALTIDAVVYRKQPEVSMLPE